MATQVTGGTSGRMGTGIALLLVGGLTLGTIATAACTSGAASNADDADDDDTRSKSDDDDARSKRDDDGDDDDNDAKDAASPADATADAAKDGARPGDKASGCVGTFADGITPPFGRLDGTVVAVVPPAHPTCPFPNSDHVALQVQGTTGVHRMVVNVQSDFGDDVRVYFAQITKPLPAPAWAVGWHLGASLDYKADFAVNPGAPTFALADLAMATQKLTDAITIGDEVSVYGSTSAPGNGAHKVHRVGSYQDGAIVVNPRSASPKVLLFHFQTQTW